MSEATPRMSSVHTGAPLCALEVSCTDFEGGKWVPMEQFLTAAPANLLRYFYALPGLLSKLCLGRNYRGINALKDVLPYTTILTLIKAESLPGVLRARFTELLLHLHVDCDPLEVIHAPVFTRVWRDVSLRILCAAPEVLGRFEGLQVRAAGVVALFADIF